MKLRIILHLSSSLFLKKVEDTVWVYQENNSQAALEKRKAMNNTQFYRGA